MMKMIASYDYNCARSRFMKNDIHPGLVSVTKTFGGIPVAFEESKHKHLLFLNLLNPLMLVLQFGTSYTIIYCYKEKRERFYISSIVIKNYIIVMIPDF